MKSKQNILLLIILFVWGCSGSKNISEKPTLAIKPLIVDENTNIDTSLLAKTTKRLVVEGAKEQLKGNYTAAIIEYQQAFAMDSNAEISYAIANCFYKLDKFRPAVDYLKDANKRKPNWAVPLDLLAKSYLSMYDIKNAIIVLEKILEIDSSIQRKMMLAQLNEFENPKKAIDLYENAYGLSDDTAILSRLNYLYLQTDQKEEYMRTLLLLFEKDNSDLANSYNIIDFYLEYNDFDKLSTFIERIDTIYNPIDLALFYNKITYEILGTKKDSIDALVELLIKKYNNRFDFDYLANLSAGNLLLQTGRLEDAEKKLEKALSLKTDDPKFPLNVANTYYFYKYFQKCVDICSKYQDIYPDTLDYFFQASSSYYLMERYSEAISELEKLLIRFPNNLEAIIQIAAIHEKQGDFSSAIAYYEKGMQIDAANPTLNNNYAYSLSENGGDLEKALKMANSALSIEPENPFFLDTYGWVKYRLGNLTEAEKFVKKSLELMKSVDTFEHLGDIYESMDRIDEAIKNWENAIELEPERDNIKLKIEKYVKK